MRSEADALAGLEAGDDDDFWNDDLSIACGLEGFAGIVGERAFVSGGEVEAILKTEGGFSYEGGEEAVREARLDAASSAPAGAWVLALGTSCVSDGRDDEGAWARCSDPV